MELFCNLVLNVYATGLRFLLSKKTKCRPRKLLITGDFRAWVMILVIMPRWRWYGVRRAESYSEIKNVAQAKGVAAIGSEVFIKGTATIKKKNFADHVKSQTHATAVLRLAEADKISTPASGSSSTSAIPSGAPKQRTLLPYLQKISVRQRRQLTNKFQLAHFLIGKNKSFKFYQDMA